MSVSQIQLAIMWQSIRQLQANEARLLAQIAEQKRQLADFNRRLAIVEYRMSAKQPQFSDS